LQLILLISGGCGGTATKCSAAGGVEESFKLQISNV
jgi:hypothetical protein